jgi:hypothetical protein
VHNMDSIFYKLFAFIKNIFFQLSVCEKLLEGNVIHQVPFLNMHAEL